MASILLAMERATGRAEEAARGMNDRGGSGGGRIGTRFGGGRRARREPRGRWPTIVGAGGEAESMSKARRSTWVARGRGPRTIRKTQEMAGRAGRRGTRRRGTSTSKRIAHTRSPTSSGISATLQRTTGDAMAAWHLRELSRARSAAPWSNRIRMGGIYAERASP